MANQRDVFTDRLNGINARDRFFPRPRTSAAGSENSSPVEDTTGRGNLVTWSGHGVISFFANAEEIRSFKDLTISTSADTEDSEESGQKFIKKTNSGSYQISMTAVLNTALGVNVQEVALSMAEAARCGDTGYFYTGEAKLFPSKFMATEAKISDVRMNASGVWTRCEVSWTLRQCGKYESASSGATSGNSGGASGGAGSYGYYDAEEPDYPTKESVRYSAAQTQTKASSSKTTARTDDVAQAVIEATKAAAAAKEAVLQTNAAKKAASQTNYEAMTGKSGGSSTSLLGKVTAAAKATIQAFNDSLKNAAKK